MKRFVVLLLAGAMFGCSTAQHPASVDPAKTDRSPLYLYWGSEAFDSSYRFLSARIHLNEEIYVGGGDFWDLKGHIDQHDTGLIAELAGSTGQQSQFYHGSMTLEQPCFAQGGAASGGAGPQYWFLLSTNQDCKAVLEQVNAVRGFTNAPFNHPGIFGPFPTPAPPQTRIFPPNERLTNLYVDPNTGLPIPPSPGK